MLPPTILFLSLHLNIVYTDRLFLRAAKMKQRRHRRRHQPIPWSHLRHHEMILPQKMMLVPHMVKLSLQVSTILGSFWSHKPLLSPTAKTLLNLFLSSVLRTLPRPLHSKTMQIISFTMGTFPVTLSKLSLPQMQLVLTLLFKPWPLTHCSSR